MAKQISAIERANESWDDYFTTLRDSGQGYVVDYIKNTQDLSKVTGDDLVQANQNARQAAIAHNAALKQQTLSAKAAKFAMSALATVGNMIVFTLISEGISKLMNAETEALEKAQKQYEATIERIESVQTAEDTLRTSTKELVELFNSEDWGAESAKKASGIYDQMIDALSDVGDVENGRIKQLEAERDIINGMHYMSEEERKQAANNARKSAISGWNSESNTNDLVSASSEARQVLWDTVEKEFTSVWTMAETGFGINTHALSENVLKKDGTTKTDHKTNEELISIMGKFLDVNSDTGQEYVILDPEKTGYETQYKAVIGFMKAFEEIKNIKGVSEDNPLYDALKEVYDELSEPYKKVNEAQFDERVQKAGKAAYSYFNSQGTFSLDTKKSEEDLIKTLKDSGYTEYTCIHIERGSQKYPQIKQHLRKTHGKFDKRKTGDVVQKPPFGG